ncbi:programmed cell death protein 2 [Tritrichomonas foetus]|uniref:Programmed cell death protein 2 n=1 Tax=Tritrichomonas foetus TaxID=1144522 RepID=A0A1J4KYC5_9EUKA|nr:programmed cell death protein 2 [Tritrichomonas foetus]|eukprot:OHT14708.1 programmed cell death protein 2 [Tritrichomonas foetus]
MSGSMVLLGVPEQPVYIPAEEGVTKIGGVPRWLCGEPENLKTTKCKTCNCNLELLASVDCPVSDDFDRIVYLFVCPKCGQDGRVYRQKKTFTASQESSTSLFSASDLTAPSGGSGDIMAALAAFNNQNNNQQNNNQQKKGQQQQQQKKGKKSQWPQKEKGKWPGFYIETFDEPEAQLDPDFHYVLSTSADSTNSIMGEEDKPDVEITPELVEYNERMSRCPDQVLRYCRFGEPLLQDKIDISVPNCPKCGGKRSFEFEVMPTIIFTLEPDSPMDFGPILIYTCSSDCGAEGTCEEHCIICPP